MSNPLKWAALGLVAAGAAVLMLWRGDRLPWWAVPLDLGAAATLLVAGYPAVAVGYVGVAFGTRAAHRVRRARRLRRRRLPALAGA